MSRLNYDYNKLRGKIVEKYGSIGAFSTEIKRSKVSVSHKMNNKVPWTQDEIIKASSLLDIPENEIGLYFFTQRV